MRFIFLLFLLFEISSVFASDFTSRGEITFESRFFQPDDDSNTKEFLTSIGVKKITDPMGDQVSKKADKEANGKIREFEGWGQEEKDASELFDLRGLKDMDYAEDEEDKKK